MQRSGQIPEAVHDDTAIAGFAATELKSIMQALPVAFPGKIGEWVDWYKVEALGSVHKYPKDKQAQEKKHGLTPEQQAAREAEGGRLAAEKAAEEAALKAKLEHAQNWFR